MEGGRREAGGGRREAGSGAPPVSLTPKPELHGPHKSRERNARRGQRGPCNGQSNAKRATPAGARRRTQGGEFKRGRSRRIQRGGRGNDACHGTLVWGVS